MAKLTLKFQGKVVRELHINADKTLTIGRDQTNDLTLDNPAVSRFHAKVYKGQWPFFIEDLGSTNGTYLNGSKVNKFEALKNNDIITIGKYELTFNSSTLDYEDDKDEPFNPDATIIIK